MGSKPWHKLTVLAAFSVLAVGCNNGPQKSNDVATRSTTGTPTAQQGPYNLPPMSQNAFPTVPAGSTVSTAPNSQFAPTGGMGARPSPVMPPPNPISNSSPQSFGGPGYAPSSNPNNPPLGGGLPSGLNNPPLGGGIPGGVSNPPLGGGLPSNPPTFPPMAGPNAAPC